MTTSNKHIGSALDDFLKEEGFLSQASAIAGAEATAALKRQPQSENAKEKA